MPNLETIHKILQQLHSIQKEKNSVKEKEIDNELFKYINDLIDEYRNKYNVLDEKLTKLETDFDTNKENIKLELEQHKTAALQEKKLSEENERAAEIERQKKDFFIEVHKDKLVLPKLKKN